MGAASGVSVRVATTVMSRVDLKAKNLQQSLPLLPMMIVVVVVEWWLGWSGGGVMIKWFWLQFELQFYPRQGWRTGCDTCHPNLAVADNIWKWCMYIVVHICAVTTRELMTMLISRLTWRPKQAKDGGKGVPVTGATPKSASAPSRDHHRVDHHHWSAWTLWWR